MKKTLVTICGVVTLACMAHSAGVFKAGAAKGNITPFLGDRIVGGFAPFPAKHVHDDLWVRALVLDDGETRLAFAVCEVIGICTYISDTARQYLLEEINLPIENVMISGVHTHSATDSVSPDRKLPKNPVTPYQEFLARRIADAVRCAVNNLEPAQIGWGHAYAPEHVFNRRRFMKPGTIPMTPMGGTNDVVLFNPGYRNPNIISQAGPTDPEVCFFALRTPEGKPLALFSNYALHYVGGVRGADISADYFGVFNDRIQQLLQADRQDPPFVAMMSNGASGDINNCDFDNDRPKHPPYEKMRIVAFDVAQKVFEAYKGIEWRDHVKLGAKYELIELKPRRATEAEMEYGKAFMAKLTPESKPRARDLRYAERAVGYNDELPETWRYPIQAFMVGNVGIASMPGEVFCETGLEFKNRAPFKPAFIVELTHGYYGYLPPPRQHDLGGYETWLGSNRIERDAVPKMVDRLVSMLEDLKQGK